MAVSFQPTLHMAEEKKLFLLDGHALVYRAHFAFINRPLINSKGVNTSAVMGFTRTLWDLMRDQKPTHIAVAFDLSTPTFRHEMYEPYKANREEQPEDIVVAIPYIEAIVKAFNIPIVTLDGFEADDVIGTLSKQAEKEGFEVYMVTPDKDFGQLVSENIFLYKPSRQGNGVDIMGVPEILKKWNVEQVEQVIDMLGLQGDSVDNIPGVPGIGPKTAAKLLAQFKSVEELVDSTEQLKGKQKERLEEHREQALLSKKLAVIDTEAPIQFNAERYQIDPPDKDRLAEIFKELEFRALSEQILGEDKVPEKSTQGDLFNQSSGTSTVKAPPAHSVAEKNIGNTEHSYHLVDTAEKRAELLQKLLEAETLCFDTETTGIDATQAELVGMSFAIEPHVAYYVPVPDKYEAAARIVQQFKPVFEDEKTTKVAQNLKYDALILRHYGVEVKGYHFDTMIVHYLLEPELRHNMNYLAETYLKYQPISIESILGKKGKKQKNMRDLKPEEVFEYAAEDADITLQLKEYLAPKLQEEGFQKLYDEIEGPLVRALVNIEYEGVNVNVDFLKAYSKELTKEIAEVQDVVHEMAGVNFNVASPKQVGEILFDKMGLPYRFKKTKSGQYSTSEDKLAELAADHPIVDKILDFRGLTKLKSTYVDALPKLVNPRTGRIHSSFNQALTATGRLSSNDPNLQNIPIRTPEGARVREAFVPRDKDHILLAADYSQIELRLIAEISGDEAMLEAFQSGKDIHSATAARVFDVPYEEVSREHRYRAKTVNFAIIYGAGATNLSQQLGIKRTEAKELIEQYFNRYPGLKKFMDETVEQARKQGFVKTIMGRRRYLRDIGSRNGVLRSHAERNAINTPVQGSAADMIKIAMVNINEEFEKQQFKSKMILQVHDELVFDAHKDELETIKPIIEDKMQNALPDLKVPILVEMGEGQNWREAH